jgi:N-hydroxyarylamine O-acetyltransferase
VSFVRSPTPADAYLTRIGVAAAGPPSPDALAALHRAHMLSVPFENLDIHLGRPHVLDVETNVAKVVERRRGGWCFELNSAFAWLLGVLGYDVTLMAARVHGEVGAAAADFAHLVLAVELDAPWLVDVGFGDSFTTPIRLEPVIDQPRDGCVYRLRDDGERLTLLRDGLPSYDFAPVARRLDDFAEMCDVLQTTDTAFTRGWICSRATEDGRLTISDLRLITTAGARRQERPLCDQAELRAVLADRFGVVLDRDLAGPAFGR